MSEETELNKKPEPEQPREYTPGVVHEIRIRVQNNAGKIYYYQDNCKISQEFLSLMQRKTFVQEDFPKLKKLARLLGLEFRIVAKREAQYFGDDGQPLEYETKE